MKLSEWALKQGISYQTALRQFKDNKLPKTVEAYQTSPGATIFVEEKNMNTATNLFDLVIQFTNEKRTISEFASKLITLYDLTLKNEVPEEPVISDEQKEIEAQLIAKEEKEFAEQEARKLKEKRLKDSIKIEKHLKDYIKENGPKVSDVYLKSLKEKAKKQAEQITSSTKAIDKIKKAVLFIKQEAEKDNDISLHPLDGESVLDVSLLNLVEEPVDQNTLPKTEKLSSCTDITYNQNPNAVTFKTTSEVEEDYEK
jgi:hypothetical protein